MPHREGRLAWGLADLPSVLALPVTLGKSCFLSGPRSPVNSESVGWRQALPEPSGNAASMAAVASSPLLGPAIPFKGWGGTEGRGHPESVAPGALHCLSAL